jgi:hypothetical protein
MCRRAARAATIEACGRSRPERAPRRPGAHPRTADAAPACARRPRGRGGEPRDGRHRERCPKTIRCAGALVPPGSQGERMEVLYGGDSGLLPNLLPAGTSLLHRAARLERLPVRRVLLRSLQPARLPSDRGRWLRSGPGRPCKPGQKRCDGGLGRTLCCDGDEYCASNRKDEGSGDNVAAVCCKRGQTFCLRGSPARPFCCPRGTRCCSAGTRGLGGFVAATCCSRLTQTCERGVCRCKPGHTVGCGKDCCHPRLHKCCGTVRKRCVPKGTDCDDALANT